MTGIQVNNVDVSLSNQQILHNVSIDIQQGDFVGIIGPNGSGKSTLLKTIYRAIKCSHGNICLDGKDIQHISYQKTAQKIGVVGQHNDIPFDFSVLEMVMMGRTPYKKFMERDNTKDLAIVKNSLIEVDMWQLKDRSYGTLSGGEKQRVILARALAQQTDYLILDEPTNHLDIRHQFEIMNLVSSMDKTVLFAVHDLSMALRYCNKVAILQQGKVVEFGETSCILTSDKIESIYGVKVHIMKDQKGISHIHYIGVE